MVQTDACTCHRDTCSNCQICPTRCLFLQSCAAEYQPSSPAARSYGAASLQTEDPPRQLAQYGAHLESLRVACVCILCALRKIGELGHSFTHLLCCMCTSAPSFSIHPTHRSANADRSRIESGTLASLQANEIALPCHSRIKSTCVATPTHTCTPHRLTDNPSWMAVRAL